MTYGGEQINYIIYFIHLLNIIPNETFNVNQHNYDLCHCPTEGDEQFNYVYVNVCCLAHGG